jgi:hypothetical protein
MFVRHGWLLVGAEDRVVAQVIREADSEITDTPSRGSGSCRSDLDAGGGASGHHYVSPDGGFFRFIGPPRPRNETPTSVSIPWMKL